MALERTKKAPRRERPTAPSQLWLPLTSSRRTQEIWGRGVRGAPRRLEECQAAGRQKGVRGYGCILRE